jgi:hypothetical protein
MASFRQSDEFDDDLSPLLQKVETASSGDEQGGPSSQSGDYWPSGAARGTWRIRHDGDGDGND